MTAILESGGIESLVRSIGHDVSDTPLELLNYLFLIGAVYGYFTASIEKSNSFEYLHYDRFWKSCAFSVAFGVFYGKTYELCQRSPEMIKYVLTLNYLHAVVTILRLVYCIYKSKKLYNERTYIPTTEKEDKQ